VLSGYGTHLVYVHDCRESEPPKFSEVETRVRQDWEDDKREQLNEQYIASLMGRYDVTIEDADTQVDKQSGVQKEQTQ
jgi:parvulin-like peptidyl-prolyl isomerase